MLTNLPRYVLLEFMRKLIYVDGTWPDCRDIQILDLFTILVGDQTLLSIFNSQNTHSWEKQSLHDEFHLNQDRVPWYAKQLSMYNHDIACTNVIPVISRGNRISACTVSKSSDNSYQ